MCESESETDSSDGSLSWFGYFKSHYLFFSAMLASKGAPFFRSRFLEFVIEDIKNEWNITEGKNRGLSEDVILEFFGRDSGVVV